MVIADEERSPPPIVLVGFMGSGKSKIGRLLAKRLDLPFADSDVEIATEFGMSITEIFGTRGEAEFRAAERRVIASLVNGAPKVIATGGGAFVDPATREALLRRARTVWLDPPFDVIATRLERSTARPLANAKTLDELRQLWTERREFYAKADVRVRTANGHPEQAVDTILDALAAR